MLLNWVEADRERLEPGQKGVRQGRLVPDSPTWSHPA